ncbi:GNAT family N-acetyltransferase [Lysobacter sp. CAU 1642]|uniref:GNAT family N-acetyltransferase n=2 Tax=Pseudomarimonas salicorniae TaxID=2933270 RepID=A0ABT0GLV2_9GAMM|nr:GNAT family N-acetyltransferase [Lysobacter sp. CAU 1642]MCK7595526.1 GNAT family N-acetyltransferase [Lysobacter sp. CAU 1642]
MPETWRTERLRATALSEAHLGDLCALHQDPEVMRHLSVDGRSLSDEETRAGLEAAMGHWQEHGFGLWAFHDLHSGEFVGRAGLKWYDLPGLDGRREVGLAYAVPSRFWQRGFATEMASGALSVGFGAGGLPAVGSWTLPGNIPSQRVMEKLGFRYQTDFEFAGLPHRYYRLEPGGFSPQRVGDPNPSVPG